MSRPKGYIGSEGTVRTTCRFYSFSRESLLKSQGLSLWHDKTLSLFPAAPARSQSFLLGRLEAAAAGGFHSKFQGRSQDLLTTDRSKHQILLLSLEAGESCDSKARGQNSDHFHTSGACHCLTPLSFMIPAMEDPKTKARLHPIFQPTFIPTLFIDHIQPRLYKTQSISAGSRVSYSSAGSAR